MVEWLSVFVICPNGLRFKSWCQKGALFVWIASFRALTHLWPWTQSSKAYLVLLVTWSSSTEEEWNTRKKENLNPVQIDGHKLRKQLSKSKYCNMYYCNLCY
jgi:hypothetical protein